MKVVKMLFSQHWMKTKHFRQTQVIKTAHRLANGSTAYTIKIEDIACRAISILHLNTWSLMIFSVNAYFSRWILTELNVQI